MGREAAATFPKAESVSESGEQALSTGEQTLSAWGTNPHSDTVLEPRQGSVFGLTSRDEAAEVVESREPEVCASGSRCGCGNRPVRSKPSKHHRSAGS
jgi:hypothetical protein